MAEEEKPKKPKTEDYTIEIGKKYILYTVYKTHKKQPFVFIHNAAGTVVKVLLKESRTNSSNRFFNKHQSTVQETEVVKE